ncbi:MAG: hypothetical protein JST26_02070 [Bacteroidetes bacterium]|nr:hypothetical protein [Bacteroidota bacterium]
METSAKHFSPEMLAILLAAEGKVISGIVCYFWVNRINPNDAVELIDNFELKFTDGSHVVISCNEENEGIAVFNNFSLADEQAELEKNFGNKIRIIPVDASKTQMWTDIPGKVLESVDLTRDGEHYLNDSVLLNFGDEKRIIQLSPADGLIIDYYEE